MATSPLTQLPPPPATDDEQTRSEYMLALNNALKSIENRGIYSVIGQLLDPGKTGSFGEAVGRATSAYGENEANIGQMRAQIAANKLKYDTDVKLREAQGRLLNNPDDTEAMSTVAQLSPSGFKDMFALQQSNRQRKAQSTFLSDPTNKEAINELMLSSPNGIKDVIELSKNAPRLKALISGKNAEDTTPFDSLLLSADPVITNQASYLRKQYLNGAIDPEKAESLAKDFINIFTQSNDKRFIHNALAGVNSEIKQLQLDKLKKDMEGKLTDEQKITFNKIIIPVIDESKKANSAIMQLDSLKSVVDKAPSGVLKGVKAKSIGTLFGTDDNTALRELTAFTKSLITQIPRLPGAQSNLDARNLEESLGRLSDITLTNPQRLELINKIREGFERLSDRGDEVRTYWEQNKALLPDITKRADKNLETRVIEYNGKRIKATVKNGKWVNAETGEELK